MPRKPRLDVPGALHHIMVRGNNKALIFRDEQDRSKFLQRLGENIVEAKCSVYAWALMSNNVHILCKKRRERHIGGHEEIAHVVCRLFQSAA
jgi:REP element-mobilizing transposase RayT